MYRDKIERSFLPLRWKFFQNIIRHRSRQAWSSVIVLPLLFSVEVSEAANPSYTLDHGEVEIRGETNFFPYSGRSETVNGCIQPQDETLYQGEIQMPIQTLGFNVPLASVAIESEGQFDVLRHPYVNLRLKHLRPLPGRQLINALLEIRGKQKPVKFMVDIAPIHSGIVVDGSLTIRQSDFGVKPFEFELLRVADEIKIQFEAAFIRENELSIPGIETANAASWCFP